MPVLRSLLFYTGYALSLMVYGPLMNVYGLVASRDAAFRASVLWCRFSVWWAKITCGIDYRIVGRENIPAGGCVVLAKHQSAWETLLVQSLFFPAATVVKRELMWIPFFGWGLRLFDPIAINRADRNNALKAVIRQGSEKIAQGRRIVIFPEGTRTLPGEQREYSAGGALLATRTKALVVPVALNSGDCWPRGTLIKKPGTITVIIGEPVDASTLSAKALNAQVQAWIEARMHDISPAYAGLPPENPSPTRKPS